jgi:hypothetical protein
VTGAEFYPQIPGFYRSFTLSADAFRQGRSEASWFGAVSFWRRDHYMSMDMPVALDAEQPRTAAEISPVANAWFETALTLLLTAATVLFVSFIAVVTGLV